MTYARPTWAALAAAALLAVAPAAPAAPVPAARGVGTRLIPDRAHFVLVVNVRQALASPLYAANLRKVVEELLKNERVPKPVRDAVPVLLRDVDRLTVVTEDACFSEGPGGGPILIAEGRLGPEWLKARAGELNAAVPDALKEADQSGVTAFEGMAAPRGPGGYLLAPDRNTVVFVPTKELFAECVAKSAGKRVTALKHGALREQLRKMTPETAVQWVGVKEMVYSMRYTGVAVPGGKTEFERKLSRLGDEGIEALTGSVSAGDSLAVRVVLSTRDADTAEQFVAKTHTMLKEMTEEFRRELPRHKGLGPVLDCLQGVKVAADGKVLDVRGRLTAEALLGVVQTIAETSGVAPPGK